MQISCFDTPHITHVHTKIADLQDTRLSDRIRLNDHDSRDTRADEPNQIKRWFDMSDKSRRKEGLLGKLLESWDFDCTTEVA
jgi:hypothetical protein